MLYDAARPSPAKSNGGRRIPRSQTIAVISAAGVTSNAGLYTAASGGAVSAPNPHRTSSPLRCSMTMSRPLRRRTVERARRRGNIERNAVVSRGDSHTVRPDLVGHVAVRRNSVRADETEIHRAGGHERRCRAVDQHSHRNAGARELPRGEPASLQQRSSFVRKDFDALALLDRHIHCGERRADSARRQRAGVAVREHARAIGNQRGAVLANATAHGAVFIANARGLVAKSPHEIGRRPTMRVRHSHHSAERPGEIHRGRSRGGDPRRCRRHAIERVGRSRFASSERQREPHGARDTDRRRAAYGERRDRVADVVDRAKIAIRLAQRQGALVENANSGAVWRPGNRLDDVHARNVGFAA